MDKDSPAERVGNRELRGDYSPGKIAGVSWAGLAASQCEPVCPWLRDPGDRARVDMVRAAPDEISGRQRVRRPILDQGCAGVQSHGPEEAGKLGKAGVRECRLPLGGALVGANPEETEQGGLARRRRGIMYFSQGPNPTLGHA